MMSQLMKFPFRLGLDKIETSFVLLHNSTVVSKYVRTSACSRDSRPRDWSRLGLIFLVSVSSNIPRDSRDWQALYFLVFKTLFLVFCYIILVSDSEIASL